MKAITLFVNSVLPEDLRDDARLLDKKSLDSLLAEIGRRYPDRYAGIVKQLSDIGRSAAYVQGETLTLQDMRPPFDKDQALAEMDAELEAVNKGVDDPETQARNKMAIWAKYADSLEKRTVTDSQAVGNNLASTVISGARGNPFQLKAMITTPALYTDYRDQTIPLFIRRSFGEGLRPYEYMASTFGTRKSIISTKNSTRNAGDLSKQLASAAAHLVVTEEDCGTANGIDLDPNDPDLAGRVLPRDVGDIPAGTPVDKPILNRLRKQKKPIVVRSPLTCQSQEGICSKCLGLLPTGKFAPKGYSAGITASNALGEPLTQGALSSKHTAGGFKGGKKVFSGFEVISQLAQSPETFPFRAAVAEVEGKVDTVEDAPQGGQIITIGGVPHYALPGFEVNVKPGDVVEAGDQLSEGIVDPYDVVQHRGLGEGRRYYVDRLKQAYEESGAGRPSRVNLELLARATLDHVRVDDMDGMGDYLPDDVASYNKLVPKYSPPVNTRMVKPQQARGQYLQTPTLHYTIGTKLTPKMLSHIESAGIGQVAASPDEPKFVPEMVRLRAAAHAGDDWLAKFNTSYITSNLGQDAARARDTDTQSNVHFAPRLGVGVGFGEKIKETGKF